MSDIGYNGRKLNILKGGTKIAAVMSKTVTHNREPVEVTNDDSDGNRTVLPDPGLRSIDVSVNGVTTSENYQDFLTTWNGKTLSDITIQHADGSTEEAEEGFFLGNLEFSGEHNGHVAFTASLMSSGPVTQISS